MGRPRIPAAERRVKISIHPRPELLEWVDRQVERGIFYNRTHAFEAAINDMKRHGTFDGDAGQTSTSIGASNTDSTKRK